jgi:hypothetical protein
MTEDTLRLRIAIDFHKEVKELQDLHDGGHIEGMRGKGDKGGTNRIRRKSLHISLIRIVVAEGEKGGISDHTAQYAPSTFLLHDSAVIFFTAIFLNIGP